MISKLRSSILEVAGSQSLSARAIQSSFWITGGFVIQRALQFGSNLILTRLLFPEAFGLMALATVFLVGLAMFSDIGLKPAIIRDPRGDDPDFLATAWTLQVIRGLCLFAAGSLLAYPVSLIYGQPILFPLLVVMSTTAAISGFQTVGMATTERQLDFLRPTIATVTGQLISIIVLVTLAYLWRSVWALAVGNVIGAIATVGAGHWILRGHRHRFRYDREAARSIVSFGRWIMLSTIVTFVGGEGLRAVQAGLLSIAEFGVLSIAYTIAMIAIELPTKLTGTIGLPALVEASRSGPDRMAHVLWQMRKRVLLLAIPTAVIVALVSNPLIALLYDERYHDAGRYVALLTLSNTVAVVFAGYSTALLAMGHSKSYLCLTIFTTASRLIGIVAGYEIYGIVGMLVGLGIANMGTLIVFWTERSIRTFTSVWPDVLALALPAIVIFTVMNIRYLL